MTSLLARTVAVAVVLVVAMPVGAAGAAEPVPVDTDAVDDFVRVQLDKHRVPGLALGVIEHGEVTHLAGFGDAGGGRPVTPDTPFVLGSISKSFTAWGVMKLVEAGRVSLDAPINDYLERWQLRPLVWRMYAASACRHEATPGQHAYSPRSAIS